MNDQDRSAIELLRVEMNGKMDRVLDAVNDVRKIQGDHEARLRSVERWKLSLPITVLLVLATVAGGLLKGVVS